MRAGTIYQVNREIVLHTAAATLPALTDATGGASIASWKVNGMWPLRFDLRLSAGGAMNLTAGQLWGWDGTLWRVLADLNGGAAIDMTATKGWQRPFELVVGITRLGIVGTLSASNLTAKAAPISVVEE
jgi:hypothetical protein